MRIETEHDLELALDLELVVAIHRMGPIPGVIRRAIREGRLVAVLPGIYGPASAAAHPAVRMAALQKRRPGAVFTGLSAAGLLWDPRFFPSTVSATGRFGSAPTGFALTRRVVDPAWVVTREGWPCTRPELTAIDLIPSHGGEFVDHALRSARGQGQRVLNRMWQAVDAHPDRRGNKIRRQVLRESRDLPWSAAERKAHAILHASGITGWETNFPVRIGAAELHIDIAFPDVKLAVEIDGFAFHSSRAEFELDRQRQNLLVCNGWRVLRFTWAMLDGRLWLRQLEDLLEAG